MQKYSSMQVSKLIIVGLWFLLTQPLLAQLPTATVLGVVKDSSEAVIPRATVTARNVDTGLTRTTVAAADGSYRLSALPVGSYELQVEQPGFRTEVQRGLTLVVGQEALVNFTLQVGQVQETVSVTAAAPLVNTTSGTLGGVVGEKTVADLPLNGRNYMDLTLLQPGITQNKNMSSSQSTVGLWFSSNGAPLRSNNYMLDGAIIVGLSGTSSATADGNTLGAEGIREYRVLTNGIGAEYGMTMGGQIAMVSKSGTNNFHGSLFEYLRNSALDARNFFDYKSVASSRRLPAFTRNQFGASFGGPIRKDKTFFFGTYEGLRQRLGVTTVDTVIPTSAKVDGGAGGVPQISPIIKPLLALYPDPNLPGNRFTFPFTQPVTDDFGQIRVDQTFSSNDMLFARYTISNGTETDTAGFPQFVQPRESRNQYGTVSENHIFSSTLLNTARVSYSRMANSLVSPSPFVGPQYSLVAGRGMGPISITGITGFGPNGTSRSVQNQNVFTWSDDVIYTHGKHAVKFGTLINDFITYQSSDQAVFGSLSFSSLANFLTAKPSQYQASTPGSITDRTYQYYTLGFYGQDDWRLRPNFTLNVGLRYEPTTQIQEIRGRGSNLRDIQHDAAPTLGIPYKNPSRRNLSPRFGFAWDVKGDGNTAVRGGFGELYDIGGLGAALQIAIQGTPPFSSLSTVMNPATLVLPIVFTPQNAGNTLKLVDFNMQAPHILDYNLTVERQLPGQVAISLTYTGSRAMNIMQSKEGNPTVPLGIPVGSVCVARPAGQAFDLNGPQCWRGNDPRTNPNWAAITYKTAAGSSWYNSFQFGLIKRLSHGLQMQSSYTLSKIIDETQGDIAAENTASSTTGADPSHRLTDRGLADFDVRHNWRLNAIYQIPSVLAHDGVLGSILNGWRMSGILSLQTGYPFTPGVGSNISLSEGGGSGGSDRPNLVPGRNTSNITSGTTAGCPGVTPGQKLGTRELWFDPCAFTLQPSGFLGTAGRNIMTLPGSANLDFSLVKDIPVKRLGESGKFEVRIEAFNILNRANFGVPARSVFSGTGPAVALGTAGVINDTGQNRSRQIQFALRLTF